MKKVLGQLLMLPMSLLLTIVTIGFLFGPAIIYFRDNDPTLAIGFYGFILSFILYLTGEKLVKGKTDDAN